jgi:hypothetical protein
MRNVFLSLLVSVLFVTAAFGWGETLDIPKATTEGSFFGTWFYVDTAYEIALFIAPDSSGLLRLRYHVRNKGGAEFETDAGGLARFLEGPAQVTVLISGNLNDDGSRIEGHYERTTEVKESRTVESGDFIMYRTSRGHSLAMQYPTYTTKVTDAKGRTKTNTQFGVMTIYRKASDMVVDFKEIPF